MAALNALNEAEKALAGIFAAALLAIGIYGYGLWQHHLGYEDHKREVAEATRQSKETQDHARTDADKSAQDEKAFIADYYFRAGRDAGRVLPPGVPVQPGSGPAHDAGGVLRCPEGCAPAADYLRCSEESAQDAAFILRQQRYGRDIGLKAGD